MWVMLMTYNEIRDLFWDMTALIMADKLSSPASQIRKKYPSSGAPDWGIDEDIIFLNVSEKKDTIGELVDTIPETINGDVILHRARTRVWYTQFTCYGPSACDTANLIKDAAFRQPVKRLLSKSGVFLVPDMPNAMQVPELFASQWWQRWDLTLTFNELYRPADENVGSIESANITTNAQP